MDRRILSSPSSILPSLPSLSQKYRTARVISDAIKARISFSLRLQRFSSSIGPAGEVTVFVGSVLYSLAAWSVI
jgi:hypothetical protein